MGGGEFSCAPSLLCHGLRGVVKPIRSLTRKRGRNLLCIILLKMYDNLEVSAAAVCTGAGAAENFIAMSAR